VLRLLRVMCALTLGCGRVGFDAPDGVPVRCASAVPQGLLGYWPMDAADVTGGVAFDRSGNGVDGTFMGTGTPVVDEGRIGDALDFAGTTLAYVAMLPIAFDTTPGAFNTVSLWFLNGTASVDESPIYMPFMPPMGARLDVWLTVRSTGMPSLCLNSGAGDCWGITDPQMTGRWVHLVATFANGPANQGRMHIDGVRIDETCRFGPCQTVRTAGNPFMISGPDTRYPWHGKVDEVRVYDRALSDAEVQELYSCTP
jgi:hypothetical protein